MLLLPLSRSGANGCPCGVSLQSITAWGSERFVAWRAQKRCAVEGHGVTATQGARWHARRDRASLIGFRTQNASFPAVPYGVALCNFEALRAKPPLPAEAFSAAPAAAALRLEDDWRTAPTKRRGCSSRNLRPFPETAKDLRERTRTLPGAHGEVSIWKPALHLGLWRGRRRGV